jgi:hypothetical protein
MKSRFLWASFTVRFLDALDVLNDFAVNCGKRLPSCSRCYGVSAPRLARASWARRARTRRRADGAPAAPLLRRSRQLPPALTSSPLIGAIESQHEYAREAVSVQRRHSVKIVNA